MSVAGLVLSAFVAAGGVDAEQARLDARLEKEQAVVEALASERSSLSALLDVLGRLTRESDGRARAFEKRLLALDALGDSLRQAVGEAQGAAEQVRERLRPHLLTLYRHRALSGLQGLLGSESFFTVLKRRRGLEALVQSDARTLEELEALADSTRLEAARLALFEDAARQALGDLKREQAQGRRRLALFTELLGQVSAEQRLKERQLMELESSRKDLEALVEEADSRALALGFRAQKGELPYPTEGRVEVGFGRVVNPRFNTVTVQKGLDLRAPLGADVVSVAAGAIAYVGQLKGYGNLVIVDHGGDYHSLYAHLDDVVMEVGDRVEASEIIGHVGETGSLKGPFLYFEIRKGGYAVDPLPWLSPAR